jgi:hypothetical protein
MRSYFINIIKLANKFAQKTDDFFKEFEEKQEEYDKYSRPLTDEEVGYRPLTDKEMDPIIQHILERKKNKYNIPNSKTKLIIVNQNDASNLRRFIVSVPQLLQNILKSLSLTYGINGPVKLTIQIQPTSGFGKARILVEANQAAGGKISPEALKDMNNFITDKFGQYIMNIVEQNYNIMAPITLSFNYNI